MYCEKCGQKLEENANFCPFCGSPLRPKKASPKKAIGKWFYIGILGVLAIPIVLALSGTKSGDTEQNPQNISNTENTDFLAEDTLSVLIGELNNLELRICTSNDGSYDWAKYWELAVYKDELGLSNISSTEEYIELISALKEHFGGGCQDDELVARAKKEMDDFLNNFPETNDETMNSTDYIATLNIAVNDYVEFFLKNDGLNGCNYEVEAIDEAKIEDENKYIYQSYQISYEVKGSINGWYTNYFSIYAGKDGYTAQIFKESGEFLKESYHSYTDGILGWNGNLYIGGYKLVLGLPVRLNTPKKDNDLEMNNIIMLPEGCDPTFPLVRIELDNISEQHTELFLKRNLEMIKQSAIVLAEYYVQKWNCTMQVEDTDIEGEINYAMGTFISPDGEKSSFWIEMTDDDLETLRVEIIDEYHNTLWKK